MPVENKISNLQIELLKLYSTDISESDLIEIKNILANYFANKLEQSFEEFYNNKNLTPKDLENWAYEHNRTSSH